MQKVAPKSRDGRAALAVDFVAGDWMVNEPEVDADLVGASGLDFNVEERGRVKPFEDSETRHRGPAGTDHRHSLSLSRIAADWRVDGGFFVRHHTARERDIALVNGSPLPLLDEAVPGPVGFRDDHQPGRVLIEAMNNAGP
jgi:hypothetical protein